VEAGPRLKLEAAFARALGEGTDAAVVAVAVAVEDGALDARRPRLLGQRLPDLLAPLQRRLAVRRAAEAGGRGERGAAEVVDELGVDVGVQAEDAQARARRAPGYFGTDPLLDAHPVLHHLALLGHVGSGLGGKISDPPALLMKSD